MSSLIILVLMMISGTSSAASPRRREIEISRSPGSSSNGGGFDASELMAARLEISKKSLKNHDSENPHGSSPKEDRDLSKILRKRRAISEIDKQTANRDSPIYFIKLPPTPYSYVPGYGYLSRPPIPMIPGNRRPSANDLQRPLRPQTNRHRATTESPVIRVPIRFVNNGKLGGVYQLTDDSVESTLNRLDRAPYFFNGRPTSLYLLRKNGRKSGKRPIRLSHQSKLGNRL